MTAGLRRATGIVIAASACALLVWISGVRYSAESAQGAIIRLAWRARGERVQRCRHLTADELAKLPVHMRPPGEQVCERGIAPYRLHVIVDDSVALDVLVRAGGAESDRPLFVFHELPVALGPHRLSVLFAREAGRADKNAGTADEDSDNRESQALRETPRHLTLDTTVTLESRSIVVVTYDDERRRLALLAAPDTGR